MIDHVLLLFRRMQLLDIRALPTGRTAVALDGVGRLRPSCRSLHAIPARPSVDLRELSAHLREPDIELHLHVAANRMPVGRAEPVPWG
jgi:hypothetical protein